MGLLSEGKPLSWKETKCLAKFVQQRGLIQFATIYKNSVGRRDACLKWGDEVEYMLVKFDHQNKSARVSLRAGEIFKLLEEADKKQQQIDFLKSISKNTESNISKKCARYIDSLLNSSTPEASNDGYRLCESYWNPEFAAYMVESTPGTPYANSTCGQDVRILASLKCVEFNMQYRRHQVQQLLGLDEFVMSVTSFPRLGCPRFTDPICDPKKSTSGSLFFPDEAIYNGHPRFQTIEKNIRERRGRRVIINLPIYRDKNTPDPFVEQFDEAEAKIASKPNHVYMDSMGFGMGCCCLQMTFQAANIDEARVLYDQLAPFCPIAMALSAASPIYRGYLTDRDCRWEVISCCVDDRTPEELGEKPITTPGTLRVTKSRYDSIDSYISRYGEKYNDIPLTYHESHYDTLIDHGVDPLLARHIAHLFIRDPITLYRERLDQSNEESDHFENIQSTNWQTMRFKPPPSADSKIGWRVEFRPLEVQTTDYENAAYVVFVALLTRLILSYRLNLLIPVSKVDENMRVAQDRDAISISKFWFRKNIIKSRKAKGQQQVSIGEQYDCPISNGKVTVQNRSKDDSDLDALESLGEPWSPNDPEDSDPTSCSQMMTIDEIINGQGDYPGLVPLLRQYLSSIETDADTMCTINNYLGFISDRAALRKKTTACWIRDFVQSHPKYRYDSIVSEEIAYDLLIKMQAMTSHF